MEKEEGGGRQKDLESVSIVVEVEKDYKENRGVFERARKIFFELAEVFYLRNYSELEKLRK